MGRKTIYNNNLTNDEKWKEVLENNKILFDEFVEYCKSEDKSVESLKQYKANLKIFFIWNCNKNNNKFFVDLTIKDVIKYQNYLMSLNLSSARIRTLKSVLSSLANYVELIDGDTYPTFKNIINKIKPPSLTTIREKTILSNSDIEKILNTLVDKNLNQIACYISLAIFSGSRKQELLQFKTCFFNEENYQKEIGMYITPEKIRTKGKGKVGKPLNKYTIKSGFEKYLKLWINERNIKNINSEWLFISHGKKAKISTINYWMDLVTKLTGYTLYSHCFRHTYVTSLCKNNVSPDVIKDIVGWNDISMISTYNDQKMEDKLKEYFSEAGVKFTEKKNSI